MDRNRTKSKGFHIFISILLLLCSLGTLLLTGCAEDSYTPDALTVALSVPFDNSFNYYDTESESNRMVIELVAGTLMREGANGEYEPYLGNIAAEEQGEKLIVTLSVKQGIRFSDGKNLTIDDLIFMYTLLADPGYTGCYADFWQYPIEGLAAYYWDDPAGTGSVPDFEAEAKENYAPEVISEEDLKRYLRETSLEGEWSGNPASYRENGRTWAEYIEDEGYGEQLSEAMSSDAALLELIVEIYYQNFADRYDATEWYARTLRREYMKATVTDGIDVPSISGISRVDDYSCTVTFYDTSADYMSILNRPLLSSANYRYTGKGSGDAAASSTQRKEIIGAGPYTFEGYESKVVTLKANRYFREGKVGSSIVFLRYAEGELIPLNCELRQFACGFYLGSDGDDADANTAAKIASLAEEYGMSCVPLRDGALVYNPKDADFSGLASESDGQFGNHTFFSQLWRVSAGK